MQTTIFLPDEAATLQLGARLAKQLRPGDLLYLQGELGAGKTVLARGLLQALGYQGKVKSPTYTLVETYEFPECLVHHFDFYRLQDPLELLHFGLGDYLTQHAICLIEWPEKAQGFLPHASIRCQLKVLAAGREVVIEAKNRDCLLSVADVVSKNKKSG